jgi:hypothetical protein
MGLVRNTNLSTLLVLLCCFRLKFGSATDTITAAKFISDPETIISNGGDFKLGFFSPPNSTDWYVGIRYAKISVPTFIWVANRNNPLKNSSGILTISEDGNLVILDGQKEVIWSTGLINSVVNSAQLSDSGNLVLQGNTTGTFLWESFQHPSNTLIENMKISTDVRTGKKVRLTSWKSPSDPSIGNFSAGLEVRNLPEFFIWNGSSTIWRSGPWNSRIFIGVPDMYFSYLDGFRVVRDTGGTFFATFTFPNMPFATTVVLNAQGNLQQTYFENNGDDWRIGWSALHTECDVYGKCGAFGSCNSQNSPICSCLRGFVPKNTQEWNGGNWTSGCVRRTPLQCERVNNVSEGGKQDGFLKLTKMKVPDLEDRSTVVEEYCRNQCLEKCSCTAYAYDSDIRCMSWTRSLIDLQKFSGGGVDLYVRVAYSELGGLFWFSVNVYLMLQIIH